MTPGPRALSVGLAAALSLLASPLAAEDPPARAVLQACGPADEALGRAAAELARRRLRGQKIASPDELSALLREAGSAATWPRSLVFVGQPVDRAQAAAETRAFVRKLPTSLPARCGVALVQDEQGAEALAVVAAPFAARAAAAPRRVRVGAWVTVDVQLQAPATDAKIVLLGPSGAPREIPASLHEGRLLGRFAADRAGRWLAQAVATLEHGPMPVAEIEVLGGDAAATGAAEAPGEGASGADDEVTLLAMVNEARRSEGLGALVRDPRLAKVAQAHAAAMVRKQVVGHDVGEGDPAQRAEAAGVRSRTLGENVARARSLPLVHRSLWSSPSHRKNTLETRWQRAGVGVVRGEDGSVWAALLFAGRLPRPSRGEAPAMDRDQSPSARALRSPASTLAFTPGTASSCSSVAREMASMEPSASSSALRVLGPIPGMPSREERRRRVFPSFSLALLENRCASSRARARMARAAVWGLSRMPFFCPGRNTRSTMVSPATFSRSLASPTMGSPWRPSSRAAWRATLSCPRPPSTTSRSGSDQGSGSSRGASTTPVSAAGSSSAGVSCSSSTWSSSVPGAGGGAEASALRKRRSSTSFIAP